jgi:hypothetical protein
MVFAFGFLVYCIGALECYPGVCFPEKIGNLPNLGVLISEFCTIFIILTVF